MPTPPTGVAGVVLAVVLAGCADAGTDHTADPTPTNTITAIAQARDLHPSASDAATRSAAPAAGQAASETSSADGRSDPAAFERATGGPEAVAAHTVSDLLEAEDLYVLHLETALETGRAGVATGRVSVAVSVLHGTGRSHPHHGQYRLDLIDTGRGWDVTAIDATS